MAEALPPAVCGAAHQERCFPTPSPPRTDDRVTHPCVGPASVGSAQRAVSTNAALDQVRASAGSAQRFCCERPHAAVLSPVIALTGRRPHVHNPTMTASHVIQRAAWLDGAPLLSHAHADIRLRVCSAGRHPKLAVHPGPDHHRAFHIHRPHLARQSGQLSDADHVATNIGTHSLLYAPIMPACCRVTLLAGLPHANSTFTCRRSSTETACSSRVRAYPIRRPTSWVPSRTAPRTCSSPMTASTSSTPPTASRP